MRFSKSETDIIKLLSMFSVVTGHIVATAKFLPSIDYSFCDYTLKIGMSCFTFLSGYGLYLSYQQNGLSNYWEKRIMKILLPAITVNAIWALIYIPLFKPTFSRVEILTYIICGNLYNKLNGSLWYITYIFLWYLVFWLVFKLCPNHKLVQLICLGIINLLIGLTIPSGIPGAGYFIFQFTLGVATACLLPFLKEEKWIYLLCFPFGVVWWRFSVIGHIESNILLYNVGIIAGTISFLLLFRLFYDKMRLFRHFGGQMGSCLFICICCTIL